MNECEEFLFFGHPRGYSFVRPGLSRKQAFWLELLFILFIIGRASAADPQPLSESQIKAGFVFNFTRFVDWPASAFGTPASPFLVCIVGSAPLSELLAETAVGKEVGGRRLTIRNMKPTDDLRACQVLYLGAGEERQEIRLFETLKSSSVLTVSEIHGFAPAGGMIGFVVQENKVKLEINLEAARHAGLKISSKLIAVSRLVSRNSAWGAN